MKKVIIAFEMVLDKDKLRLVKTISQIRVKFGNKEFVVKYSKKN